MPRGASESHYHDDIVYPETIPFVIVHVVCFAALWSGITVRALVIGMVLYLVRMFAVTGGYHRYFSHRSFKAARWFQFTLAFLAQSSAQKNVLWWAAVHRHHHKHSDTEEDVHSPRHRGFLYSHFGWIFSRSRPVADSDGVSDFDKYPELRFLQRFQHIPPVVVALLADIAGGWPGLIVGFFWSTVLLFHCTFFINSLAHVHGNQRYATGDDSRNNWWLAVITLGEGWHNNHHAYQRSARQGFRWYEFDVTFYLLTVLSWVGVVWDLGTPPAEVVRNERPLARTTIERIAQQLASSFAVDQRAGRLSQFSYLPTIEELRVRARSMIPHTPSMDDICTRACEMIHSPEGDIA